MTVAELIAKLKTMDQSLPVWLSATPDGCGPCPLTESNDIYEADVTFTSYKGRDQVRAVVIYLM